MLRYGFLEHVSIYWQYKNYLKSREKFMLTLFVYSAIWLLEYLKILYSTYECKIFMIFQFFQANVEISQDAVHLPHPVQVEILISAHLI